MKPIRAWFTHLAYLGADRKTSIVRIATALLQGNDRPLDCLAELLALDLCLD
ncbi:hypothetical protein [Polynucleobacter sp. AP-Latsch-80-C2]|uniref:hypothetical protein n=1 Tax=Polynucleobacter sp. AP-Latsch-80-C2 TaxID=2576931 RepID=UPI001C0B9A46|nr:hypothetical protein [Polynucleobacter sp. AP-Latsch-80-C2]MBU3624413.1 hypothetical protein [Polynucleobacter sp. AP-Latsch-80-C2]